MADTEKEINKKDESSEEPKEEKKQTRGSGKSSNLQKFLGRFFFAIPFQERINFARHLSIGIKSGLSVIESLRLIKSQVTSGRFVKIIDQIIADINNGQFLAQSLERWSNVFGEFFISMVRVGETSGNLSSTLIYLSRELQKQKEVSHKIRSALVYPIIILVATIGITLFLTLFIFPKILPIFVSLGVQLPITTRFIIGSLTFLEKFGLYFLGAVVLLFAGLRASLLFRPVHFAFDSFLLSIPFLSRVIMNMTMTNFTRSLSVLLKSGMTLIDALKISKGTFHSLVYKKEIDHLILAVEKGESMARHLGSEPKLFTPMMVGMIRVGESTGNLEENLIYLSEYYESEVDETVRNLTTILEPLLLLVMGLLVGFVALSIITPIYKITEGLRTR